VKDQRVPRTTEDGRDVTDNVFYWNFVVLAWLPLYALLDWVPRL